MSEVAQAQESAPAAESQVMESADLSFFDAIDAALNPAPEAQESQPAVVEKQTVPDKPTVDAVEDQNDKIDSKLPIDDDDVTQSDSDEDFDIRAEKSFARIKSRLRDARTELESERNAREQLEARLKELEAADNSVAELRNQINEYEQQLSVVKLESTKAYKEQVQEPLKFIVESLDEIANRNEIDANALIDAIAIGDVQEQDAALGELLIGMSERDKLKIYALAEEVSPILERRQTLYDNVDAALKELEEQQRIAEEAQAIERMQSRKSTVELVGKKLADKVPFLKDDEYNLGSLVNQATQTDFETLDPANKSYSFISGLLVPKLVKQLSTMQAQLEQAYDELNGYKKSSPSAGANQPSSSRQTVQNGSFLDAINAALG